MVEKKTVVKDTIQLEMVLGKELWKQMDRNSGDPLMERNCKKKYVAEQEL